MAAGDILTIDQYSPLSHKLPLADVAPTNLAPTWVPDDQTRRLNAYKVLAAYRANVARHLAAGTLTDADRAKRREYGDAELLVARTTGGVLGDQIQLIVDGADEDLPDVPDLPPAPDPLDADATPLDRRIHASRTARWNTQAEQIVDQWEADWAAQPGLIERQNWLRSWAEDEFLIGKIVEAEGDIVGLGDGVYVLDWSTADQRPTVDVYDPGFYFPVLTDDERGYPTRVHVAWEFDEKDSQGATRRYVRRLTYELGPIPFDVDPDGNLLGAPLNDDPTMLVPQLQDGDVWDDDLGLVVRTYPWAPVGNDGEAETSTVTCLFTDATWELSTVKHGTKITDLSPDGARYARTDDGQVAYRLDKHLDFLPVVHIPNTPATREHFGRSILDVVAQLLDDLHAADTDVRLASELAAGPMIALFGGATAAVTGYEPGTIVNVPGEGRMDVLDLTKGLKELRDGRTDLRDRLSVNAQVPAEVLGVRNNEGQAPSGISIALRFGPFRGLIDLLRLTRIPKYQLMLKMAQRLAQAGGVLEPGENPVARIVFGSFLPSDVAEAIKAVVELLTQHGISRLTALRMLVDAGVDIGDLAEELDRIRAEDTAGAVQVADATGSEQLAAEHLGVDLPEPTTVPVVPPPTITLPVPEPPEA